VLWLGIGPPDGPNVGSGLLRYDTKSGLTEHFENEPTNPRSLSNNRVFGVSEDSRGNFLIATARGVNRFDRTTKSFERFLPEPDAADPGANFILNAWRISMVISGFRRLPQGGVSVRTGSG